MTKNEARNLLSGTIVSNKRVTNGLNGKQEDGYDYRVIGVDCDVLSLELVNPCPGTMYGRVFKIDINDIEKCENLYIKDESGIVRQDKDGETFDGRPYSSETISYDELRPGDVVIDTTGLYRTLTMVNDDVASYFSDGRYWSLPYDKCSYVVRGQGNHPDAKLLKVVP